MSSKTPEDNAADEHYAGITRELRERGLGDVDIAVQIINHLALVAQDMGIRVFDMGTDIAAIDTTGSVRINSKEEMLGQMVRIVNKVQ